jgi:hypothetical protein
VNDESSGSSVLLLPRRAGEAKFTKTALLRGFHPSVGDVVQSRAALHEAVVRARQLDCSEVACHGDAAEIDPPTPFPVSSVAGVSDLLAALALT